METVYVLSAGLEIFFAIVAFILLIGCGFDSDRKRNANRIFCFITVIDVIMNLLDAYIWVGVDSPEYLWLMKILIFLSYGMGCAILALFTKLILAYIQEYLSIPQYLSMLSTVLTIAMLTMWFISLFNDMYYYWDENGICQTGDLFYISQLFGLFFLFYNIILVWIYRETLGEKDSTVLIAFNIIPLLSFVISALLKWEATPLYGAITISLLLYYAIIHVEHGQRVAEQETKLVKQELELINNRTAIMLSQIQPHFLYNTLTAIAQLCVKNPQKAKEMTLSFSDYLRQNMAFLDQEEPIKFSKALEHMQIYLSIEQIRFGDFLHVTYDIQSDSFLIPALCLQPIVENAVKHGIRQKEDGGTIAISTRELSNEYLIEVTDDGVGFDPTIKPDDGRTHIGISNVRERLYAMVQGTMEIKSEIGNGTTVKIRIPKGERQHGDMGGR